MRLEDSLRRIRENPACNYAARNRARLLKKHNELVIPAPKNDVRWTKRSTNRPHDPRERHFSWTAATLEIVRPAEVGDTHQHERESLTPVGCR